MRQVGFLAAAAIYALNNNVERLKEDNDKAKYFGNEISKISGIEIDLKSLQTNIVIFSSSKYSKEEFMNKLKDKGVLISSGSYDNMRAVFHLDVTGSDVEKAIETIKSI